MLKLAADPCMPTHNDCKRRPLDCGGDVRHAHEAVGGLLC